MPFTVCVTYCSYCTLIILIELQWSNFLFNMWLLYHILWVDKLFILIFILLIFIILVFRRCEHLYLIKLLLLVVWRFLYFFFYWGQCSGQSILLCTVRFVFSHYFIFFGLIHFRGRMPWNILVISSNFFLYFLLYLFLVKIILGLIMCWWFTR